MFTEGGGSGGQERLGLRVEGGAGPGPQEGGCGRAPPAFSVALGVQGRGLWDTGRGVQAGRRVGRVWGRVLREASGFPASCPTGAAGLVKDRAGHRPSDPCVARVRPGCLGPLASSTHRGGSQHFLAPLDTRCLVWGQMGGPWAMRLSPRTGGGVGARSGVDRPIKRGQGSLWPLGGQQAWLGWTITGQGPWPRTGSAFPWPSTGGVNAPLSSGPWPFRAWLGLCLQKLREGGRGRQGPGQGGRAGPCDGPRVAPAAPFLPPSVAEAPVGPNDPTEGCPGPEPRPAMGTPQTDLPLPCGTSKSGARPMRGDLWGPLADPHPL